MAGDLARLSARATANGGHGNGRPTPPPATRGCHPPPENGSEKPPYVVTRSRPYLDNDGDDVTASLPWDQKLRLSANQMRAARWRESARASPPFMAHAIATSPDHCW